MTRGRPSEYKPEYCQKAIEHLAKGLSLRATAGELGISHDTIYDWQRKFPDFSDAIKEGIAKGEAFWEKIGMAGATGKIKNFSAAAWIFNMKNRFKWTDRVEVAGEDIKPIILGYDPKSVAEE